MTADPSRVESVAGQVPLPGMPDDGILYRAEHGPDPAPLSYGRRLTLRQRADVDRGIHPLTRGKARPDLGTCGGCAHLEHNAWGYLKCGLGPNTHGPGTDVRAWWPACDRFEPGDRISDDAARWTPEHASRGGR